MNTTSSHPLPIRPEIVIDDHTRAYLQTRGYSIQAQIGTGTYGTIFTGKMIKETKDARLSNELVTITKKEERQVAVKVIDKRRKIFNVEMYNSEVKAMQRLRHDYLISSYALFESSNLIMIFMDYAEGGDLLTLLLQNGALHETGSQTYFRQLTSALNYMHEVCWLAHLDVKCDNILLYKGVAKLSDFGFTADFLPLCVPTNFHYKKVGTFEYNPPQLMFDKPVYHPPKVDVYSAGITLFIMVFGRFLFVSVEKSNSKKWSDIRSQQLNYMTILDRKLVSNRYSRELKDLLYRMLNPNELHRPSMKNILEDSWLNKPCPSIKTTLPGIGDKKVQTAGPSENPKKTPNSDQSSNSLSTTRLKRKSHEERIHQKSTEKVSLPVGTSSKNSPLRGKLPGSTDLQNFKLTERNKSKGDPTQKMPLCAGKGETLKSLPVAQHLRSDESSNVPYTVPTSYETFQFISSNSKQPPIIETSVPGSFKASGTPFPVYQHFDTGKFQWPEGASISNYGASYKNVTLAVVEEEQKSREEAEKEKTHPGKRKRSEEKRLPVESPSQKHR